MLQLEMVAIEWTNTACLRETPQQEQPQQHFYTKNTTFTLSSRNKPQWHNKDTIEATYYGSVYTSGSRRALSNNKRREPDVRYVTLNIEKFLCFLPHKT